MEDFKKILESSSKYLKGLEGHCFETLEVHKPDSLDELAYISRVVSKLSPMIGNLIEFKTVEYLNKTNKFKKIGAWHRQDPGFPDAIFIGEVDPSPGVEIKTWFPLATEITARFKDSQNHFLQNQTNVAMLAWLPEHLLWGKPVIIGVCVLSAKSIAEARDSHYHNPPDYIILEPEDTSLRTSNLQQSNTNGYKWQGTADEFNEAQRLVKSWKKHSYCSSPQFQASLRELIRKFKYRLDTNFAKMDRIKHQDLNNFKTEILNYKFNGITLREWIKILNVKDDIKLQKNLQKYFFD